MKIRRDSNFDKWVELENGDKQSKVSKQLDKKVHGADKSTQEKRIKDEIRNKEEGLKRGVVSPEDRKRVLAEIAALKDSLLK